MLISKATCLTLRGHQHRLYLPTTRNTARYNFYSHRIIGAWNSLPVKKVNFNSLSSFRNSLSSDILVNLCKLSFAWVIAAMHVRFFRIYSVVVFYRDCRFYWFVTCSVPSVFNPGTLNNSFIHPPYCTVCRMIVVGDCCLSLNSEM